MQYIITAYDGENALERRMAARPRHLEGVKAFGNHILCAGGLLDGEGNMKGSVLIVDFEDRSELDQYLNSEPYILESVWERVEVRPMNVVILDGEMVGK